MTAIFDSFMMLGSNNRLVRQKLSVKSRLYIYTVVSDPLLFFILTDPNTFGLALTLSRVFQVLFLLYLGSDVVLNGTSFTFTKPPRAQISSIFLYLALVVLGSLAGVFILETYTLAASKSAVSLLATPGDLWRGTYYRPFLEIMILIYYFLYFAILPFYMIRSRSDFDHLLNVTLTVFKCVLVVGFIDLIFFSFFTSNIIPRHLVDSRWIDVGLRFHGIAGEPRDAFPYLCFGYSVACLKSYIDESRMPSRLYSSTIGIALLLTQSVSGMIGIVLSAILLVCSSRKINIRTVITFIITSIILVTVTILVVSISARFEKYFDAATVLFDALGSGADLPLALSGQAPNIYPLLSIYSSVVEYDYWTVFFGTGIGGASFINNRNIDGPNELMNPHSHFVRILVENGVLGVFLYCYIFISALRRLLVMLQRDNSRTLYVSFILLLGSTLAHRSSTIYIFLGMIIWLLARGIPAGQFGLNRGKT